MSVTHGQFGYSTIHGSETLRLPRVTRLQDSKDSETPDTPREHDVTHWRKTANVGICCGYWCRHNSKGSLTSYQSERCILCDFIFKKRRNSIVQASPFGFVMMIRFGRFEVTFPHISQMNHHKSYLYGGSHQAIIGKCKN